MNLKKSLQPTDSELEILHVLWKKGSATVREVYEELKDVKNTGYTTTLKTMQIMTEKGMLKRDISNRTHVYYPVISIEKTQKQFMNKLITGLFDGSASRMVIGALEHQKLTTSEIREIRNFLNRIKES